MSARPGCATDSSAQQPQLPGRLLQTSDIKADLQGRQAEMYWPEDNMW